MSNDAFTTLNPGSSGDSMDESGISYGSAPTLRKRPRVVIGGDDAAGSLAGVINTQPVGSEYGLVTRNIPAIAPVAGTPIAQYGNTTLVSSGSETTVASYTVPTGHTFYVCSFVATGNVNARYTLYLNGQATLVGISSVANLNVDLSMRDTRIGIGESLVVNVTASHANSGIQANFDATILGYLI